MIRPALTALMVLSSLASVVVADEFRVGAAAAELQADDSMVIGGGIGPGKLQGQEGKLRAVAVIIETPGSGKLVIAACDVLMMGRDLLEEMQRAFGSGASGDRVGFALARLVLRRPRTGRGELLPVEEPEQTASRRQRDREAESEVARPCF